MKRIFATLVVIAALMTIVFSQAPVVTPNRTDSKGPETIQLDENTVLKLTNAQLQVQLIQTQIEKALTEFMGRKGLKPEEWTVDTQKMALIRREKELSPASQSKP